MATLISGSQGRVTLGSTEKGATIVVTGWEGTITQDIIDATPFTVTDNARVKALGMSTMTGTITGYMLDSIAPEIGTAATDNTPAIAGMILQTSASRTYTFAAVIGTMNVSTVKTGEAGVTLNFESSGDLTIA